jgi:hypothetical protein
MKKIIILTAIIFLVFTGLSLAAQKTITTYIRAGNMATYLPTVDPLDFVTNDPAGAMSGSIADNNLSLGNNKYDSAGSYIYGGDSDIAFCVQGKCVFGIGVRVYFDFTFQDKDSSSNSTAQADGLTFFIINGSNNNKNSTGGSPVTTSMGELLGYGGPGRTDGLGLRPPKMGIEFDTYPNTGTGSVCSSGSRADANNNNHMALMFWGDSATGNCTISGNNYPVATFDDNQHGSGTGNNPVNSSNGDGSGGYYAGAKNGSYNWLEDGVTHHFRIEITRSSSGVYNIKAWVDCPSCTADQLKTFEDLTVPYDNETLSPKRINRTVTLTAADHQAFNTMLFGWGFATGGATQIVELQNFHIYFPRSSCAYVINPASASPSSAAQSGNIGVLATNTAACAWTPVSDSSWLTWSTSPGVPVTGNGTVTYTVSNYLNYDTLRSGNLTIGDQIFTVNQAAAPCTLTIAANSFACKTNTGNNRVYIKVYLTDGAGNPVTDATSVTWTVSGGGGSGNLTNLGGGYYGGTQTSTCSLYGSTANCARSNSINGSPTVTVTATRAGCTGSPLTKTMTVP